MGATHFPVHKYAWAHGPSLRLISPLAIRTELMLEAGWAPGRDGAVLLHANITQWTKRRPWLGVGGGVLVQPIGLDEDRALGQFVAVVGQISVRKRVWDVLKVRAGAGPSLAYSWFEDDERGFALGLVGSAGVEYVWR